MPFVKDTSYREIPYSPETPSDEFHSLVSLSQLLQKIWKHQNHVYRCRCVGTVTSENCCLALREIDDYTVVIRLSLERLHHAVSPYIICSPFPVPVQIFGLVHWVDNVGPVMFPQTMMDILPSVAFALRDALVWATEMHYARPDVDTAQKRSLESWDKIISMVRGRGF